MVREKGKEKTFFSYKTERAKNATCARKNSLREMGERRKEEMKPSRYL